MTLAQKTKYLNFKPTEGFRLYADAILTRLIDFAPSDSASSFAFEKKEGGYACKIEIVSAVQRFEAFIEAVNPKAALEGAQAKIAKQLEKWRSHRFAALAAISC